MERYFLLIVESNLLTFDMYVIFENLPRFQSLYQLYTSIKKSHSVHRWVQGYVR